MANIDNLDFLNLNSLRSYPIRESCSKVDNSGVFYIPNDLILDLRLSVSASITKRYYISKLTNFGNTFGLEISDENSVLVGTYTVEIDSHVKYQRYELTPSEYFPAATGGLVLGSFTQLNNSLGGSFYFSLANAEIEMQAITPAIRGINRLVFYNADGSVITKTGDVEIEARTNVKFKAGAGNRVIIDAGEGIGLNTLCDNIRNAIKTINGIGPDENGNFTLDFADCASFAPIPANTGIVVTDECCKPCMGCNDVAELTQRLITLETALLQLRNFYSTLDNRYQEFKTITEYTCDCPPET